MYYLPIYINNRKFHVCSLSEVVDNQGSAYEESPSVFEFVIPNTVNENTLFSILKDTKFVSSSGMAFDLPINKIGVQAELQKGRTLIFNFSDSNKKQALDSTDLTAALAMRAISIQHQDKKKKDLLLVSAPNNRVTPFLDVEIRLQAGQQLFACKMRFHIASPEHIHEVIFDFGSEASQISVSKQIDKKPQSLDVIQRLEEYFYLTNDERAKEISYLEKYHQYDPGEPDLFKSIFFIKKKNGKFDFTDQPNQYKEEDLIKILTKKKKQDDLLKSHFITPNLKLSELVDYFDEYIKFKDPADNPVKAIEPAFIDIKEDIYRNIINKFIHTALAKIARSSRADAKQYYNIVLLVPNVYNQAKVYSLVENLYADLGKYCEKYNFAGGEINTLSESDASFLGMLSDNNINDLDKLTPNSNYLIVDAGKGTMDISIIRVNESDKNFSSIYRGGIAGSGHIITYAFIETLATIWMGRNKTKRRKFMMAIIKADTTRKLRFLDTVERLKKRFSKAEETKKASIETFNKVMTKGFENLDDVTDFLNEKLIEEGLTIQDYFGCIHDCIEELAGEIRLMVEKSGVQQFEKVILAGRAFRFKSFVEAVIDQLDIEAVAYDSAMSKKICIVGATTNKTINFDSNLIGLPIIKPAFNVSEDENKKRSFSFKEFLGFFRRMFDPSSRVPTVPPKITEININADFFKSGFSVNLSSFNVHVGGTRYLDNIPARLKSDKTIYNIFFTGRDFKVRTHFDAYSLKPALPRYNVNPPVWKSIFPFVEWNEEQIDDIPILDLGAEFDYYFNKFESDSLAAKILRPNVEVIPAFDDDIMEDLESSTKKKKNRV